MFLHTRHFTDAPHYQLLFPLFFQNPRLLQRNTVISTFQENSQESGAISTMPMPVKNLPTRVLKTKKLKIPMQVWLSKRVRTALSVEKPLFSLVIILENLLEIRIWKIWFPLSNFLMKKNAIFSVSS